MKPNSPAPNLLLAAVGFLFFCLAEGSVIVSSVMASHHYTEKQMSALAERVGTTFWIQAIDNRTPNFSEAPTTAALSFRARAGDSFEIIDLVGRKNKDPYYKVRFASGKEGYLRPEAFLQEFNLTILTVDPLEEERKQAATKAEEDKKRAEWVNAQPWSSTVKEAVLKGQLVYGFNREEVKRIAGTPSRIHKVQGRGTTAEEYWFYPDGKQLIFQNGLLVRINQKPEKKPE